MDEFEFIVPIRYLYMSNIVVVMKTVPDTLLYLGKLDMHKIKIIKNRYDDPGKVFYIPDKYFRALKDDPQKILEYLEYPPSVLLDTHSKIIRRRNLIWLGLASMNYEIRRWRPLIYNFNAT